MESRLLFNPEDKDKLKLSYVEELKKAMGLKQTSNFLFMMIEDSLAKNGKIEEIKVREESSSMIFEFKEAK